MTKEPANEDRLAPHVLTDEGWIPVDETEFLNISEDIYGKDLYEFVYNKKTYKSNVVLRYKA